MPRGKSQLGIDVRRREELTVIMAPDEPCDEHPARIPVIRVQRIRHHVHDRITVRAPVMRKSRSRRHVPAGAVIRRLGVDDDEAVLLREGSIRGVGVVRRRGAGAVVDSNNDSRARGQVLRDIDVHLSARGVGPEVVHLLQRRALHELPCRSYPA